MPRRGSKGTLFIYVLVEHKSGPDRWTVLQRMGYLVDIRKQYHRDHPRQNRLPPIIMLMTAPEIYAGTRFVTAVRLLQVRDPLPDDDRTRTFLRRDQGSD